MEVDQVDFRELTETCRPKKKRLAECYTYSIRCASRLRQSVRQPSPPETPDTSGKAPKVAGIAES